MIKVVKCNYKECKYHKTKAWEEPCAECVASRDYCNYKARKPKNIVINIYIKESDRC
jgi:hypothetical protein